MKDFAYRECLFLLIVLVLSVASCKQKTLSPNNYLKWVSDSRNGLFKETSVGEFKYAIQYKTKEYIILKRNNSIEMEELNKVMFPQLYRQV